MLRTGSPWCALPEEYGSWHTGYNAVTDGMGRAMHFIVTAGWVHDSIPAQNLLKPVIQDRCVVSLAILANWYSGTITRLSLRKIYKMLHWETLKYTTFGVTISSIRNISLNVWIQ